MRFNSNDDTGEVPHHSFKKCVIVGEMAIVEIDLDGYDTEK